ncbi:MAG TPA: hypothetical protein VJI15_01180 [Candidatus Nanoarchaeia archaeon]|nr:hypothetical protein [Candidatus Nanoarchaeia archaeon]
MVNEQVFNSVMQMRSQGLTDNLIMAELGKRGVPVEEVQDALGQADMGGNEMSDMGGMPPMYQGGGMPQPPMGMPMPSMPSPMSSSRPGNSSPDESNIYERIEEIAEGMIDEKWDELIAEVKKIIQWKEKVEEKQASLSSDLQKLKDDFKILHSGVLGKLEDYDTRMRDVGTELKAVGKVFKDVVPEFVENVKELRDLKNELKKR